jgi:insulysin
MLLIFLVQVFGEVLMPSTSEDQVRVFTLENKLTATVISSKTSRDSGVSIAVDVGSSHEPLSGLAHFLEHLLFFSSKTFPQEDYWTTFVNTHGGYTNAYTDPFKTVYFFSVGHSALEEGIHIVSRAFAEPIFSPEAAKREINAIRSEREKGYFDEDNRLFFLICNVLGRPFNGSVIGDVEGLAQENVTDLMYEFFNQYYTANNIKVSIVGNQSLDVLEKWVKKYFSDLKPGENSENIQYEKKNENFAVGAKVTDGDLALGLWVVPRDSWEFQEVDFLCYLISYSLKKFRPGEYQIMKYLENKINSVLIVAGFVDDQSSPEYMFSVILDAVVDLESYSNETLFELWLDYRSLNLNGFLYSDSLAAVELALKVSENMLMYPEYLYYAGNSVKFYYSYEIIQGLVRSLVPETASYVYFTNNEKFELDRFEDFYNFEYRIERKIFEPGNFSFKRLKKNLFIPHSLKLVMNKFTEGLLLMESSSAFNYWFKYNTSLRKPVVSVGAFIICNDWKEMKPLAFIHLALVAEQMEIDLEYWGLAGYSFALEVAYGGIEIKVSGWNERILEYFQIVLKGFLNPNSSRFGFWRNLMVRSAENQVIESYKLGIEYLNRLLTRNYYTTQELIEKWKHYSISDYIYFEADLKYSRVDLFIFGNTNMPNISFIKTFFILCENIKKEEKISLQVKSSFIFASYSEDQNSILNWYEFGLLDSHTYAILSIIEILLKDNAFIYLRTQSQLGYTVGLGISNSFLSNALYLIVQGTSHSPDSMQVHINRFWNESDISLSDFSLAKEILQASFNPIQSFSEIFNWNWNLIQNPSISKLSQSNFLDSLEVVSYSEVKLFLSKIRSHYQELSIRLSPDFNSSQPSISINHFQ